MARLTKFLWPVLALLAALAFIAAPPRPSPVAVPRSEAKPNGVIREGGRVWIDLNRADEALLTAIPGVGPVLAGRIRARIDEKGALTAPEQLLEVEGIGPAKLRAIERMAFIGPARAPSG